jgi:energy-coupling factor transport system permease protein
MTPSSPCVTAFLAVWEVRIMATVPSEGPSGTRLEAHERQVPAEARWRTRDIVVAAVIGVAFGVAFVAFGVAWRFFDFLGPAQNLLYGIWLMPAIVAALVIRKPGAALFAEMVAAGLSLLLGAQWGPDVLLSGFVQGAAAELVFAFTLYRVWSFPVLAVAALASAAGAWIHDWVVWYPEASIDFMLVLGAFMGISAVALLPMGSILLVRALREAGVLEGFPA